ncbi:SOS response-associated peptidase [Nanohaloarchaea archaeon H01]|nr:SOS response-associated peptidase [Nanohaloarchaea archaeon H01]
MCGRNSLYVHIKKLRKRYNASFDNVWKKSYNISPGNNQPTVTKNSPKRLRPMKWGFIPHFAENDDEKRKWRNRNLINARVETVKDKNTFRKSFQKRKCLVPSTGFYEWKDEGKPNKTPYHIKPSNRKIFSFAGFYNDGTFVILTKESENSKMADIHDRTPVILPIDREEKYLDGEISKEDLEGLEATELEIKQVSREVNDPENDSKDVLKPESKQSSLSNL